MLESVNTMRLRQITLADTGVIRSVKEALLPSWDPIPPKAGTPRKVTRTGEVQPARPPQPKQPPPKPRPPVPPKNPPQPPKPPKDGGESKPVKQVKQPKQPIKSK
jgi:hypothetical protein